MISTLCPHFIHLKLLLRCQHLLQLNYSKRTLRERNQCINEEKTLVNSSPTVWSCWLQNSRSLDYPSPLSSLYIYSSSQSGRNWFCMKFVMVNYEFFIYMVKRAKTDSLNSWSIWILQNAVLLPWTKKREEGSPVWAEKPVVVILHEIQPGHRKPDERAACVPTAGKGKRVEWKAEKPSFKIQKTGYSARLLDLFMVS